IEHGDPYVEVFTVSPQGELLDKNSTRTAYKKTAAHLKNAAVAAACNPKYEKPLKIVNFELQVTGFPMQPISFTEPKSSRSAPPKPLQIVLTKESISQTIKDPARVKNNIMPRDVLIKNKSDQYWSISSQDTVFPACADFLRDLAKPPPTQSKLEAKFVNMFDDPITLKPGQSIQSKMCFGGTVSMEPTLPACPKFFCLKGCKC
ncbi:MAG: hypothetical protein ACREO9_09825, partial [Lysobacterales bacterium]